MVKAAFHPPPKWLRPGMEVVSVLDADEPGEQGAAELAEACRQAVCRTGRVGC